jgi:hypothetical protein
VTSDEEVVGVVEDAAIVFGLGLIYFAMLMMILVLGRIFVHEQDANGYHRPARRT